MQNVSHVDVAYEGEEPIQIPLSSAIVGNDQPLPKIEDIAVDKDELLANEPFPLQAALVHHEVDIQVHAPLVPSCDLSVQDSSNDPSEED